jgi:hypothetical protein
MHRLNNEMKNALDPFQTIQSVPVREELFASIEKEIVLRGKNMYISTPWVRAAMVFAAIIISSECYFFIHQMQQQRQRSSVEYVAYNPAYQFSYE